MSTIDEVTDDTDTDGDELRSGDCDDDAWLVKLPLSMSESLETTAKDVVRGTAAAMLLQMSFASPSERYHTSSSPSGCAHFGINCAVGLVPDSAFTGGMGTLTEESKLVATRSQKSVPSESKSDKESHGFSTIMVR